MLATGISIEVSLKQSGHERSNFGLVIEPILFQQPPDLKIHNPLVPLFARRHTVSYTKITMSDLVAGPEILFISRNLVVQFLETRDDLLD
jgi:hypothetical protein